MINEKQYTATNDYVFKRIFGHAGNEKITKRFIKCITGVEYNEIELDNTPILEADLIDSKMGVLDVFIEGEKDTNIDIEMQVTSKEYMADRILWYWSKLYSKDLEKGKEYSQTKKTICILIADFKLKNLKNIPKYMTKWKIREDEYREEILTDKLEIYIIELEKLKEGYKDKNKELIDWCEFIKAPESLDKSVIERNEYIKMASEELEKVNNDKKERRLAELREKAVLDEIAIRNTGYSDGKTDGIKEGIKEGEKKEKINIAKKLLDMKMSIDTIIEATGLTKEEIESIKK